DVCPGPADACRGNRRPRHGPAFRGQPVQVAARPAGRLLVLPPGLDVAAIGQPHEDRVERAGLEPGLLGEVVAVPPRGSGERLENGHRLRRESSRVVHGDEVYLGRAVPSRATSALMPARGINERTSWRGGVWTTRRACAAPSEDVALTAPRERANQAGT